MKIAFVALILLSFFKAQAAKELIYEKINTAILTGNLSQIKDLLREKKDIDEPILEDETILMHAASEGQLDVVRWLHKNRADLDRSTKEGHRALSFAILGGHSEMASWLVKHGAEVDFKHEKSELNPLFDAITVNDLRTAKIILGKRPELINSTTIDLETRKRYSPIQWAQRYGQTDLEEFLSHQLASKKRFK